MHIKTAIRVLVMALALSLVAGVALAAENKAEPVFDKYPQIVEAPFVKDVVDGKTKGYIFDSRPKRTKYDKGHIPGAVSLPFSSFAKMKGLLPADKDALVVFYCGGLKCPLSHKSAFAAEKLGYKNIKVFAKGYPEWVKVYGKGPKAEPKKAAAEKAEPKFEKYPQMVEAAFVKDVVDGKTLGVVIDSRPKKTKYDKGHIPGSLSLPFSSFAKMKGLLPADKNALVVFYCGGLKCPLSHKSAFAAEKLGYKNIKVFAKGYPEWAKVYGKGVGSAPAKAAAASQGGALKAGPSEGTVDPAYFAKIYKSKPESILIVDVRDPAEYEAGTFSGAINIPTDKLEAKLNEGWKPGKPVVFVCGTGARSGEAYYMVQDLRPDLKDKVYFMDGELEFDGKGGYKYTPPK